MRKLRDFDRAELVRLERIRACHAEDRPSAREITAALTRLGATRQRHHEQQRFTRVLVVAAAVLLSTLGAFATTEKLGLTALVARWQAKETPATAARPLTRPRLLPRAAPPLPPPASSRDTTDTARAPALSAAPPARSGSRTLTAAPGAPDGSTEAWQKAAVALRHGNQPAAQEALKQLARSEDDATRSAALLARAELDLVSGEEQRARTVLKALAERGATPFVRTRARQILAGER